MINELPHACEQMTYAVGEPTLPVEYDGRTREYHLIYEGGRSTLDIEYCPFCGQQLPTSLNEVWIEALARRGFEYLDAGIPADLQSDQWWRGTELDRQ